MCAHDVVKHLEPPARLSQTNTKLSDAEYCRRWKNLFQCEPSQFLYDSDHVPGSKFEREPENHTVKQLKC